MPRPQVCCGVGEARQVRCLTGTSALHLESCIIISAMLSSGGEGVLAGRRQATVKQRGREDLTPVRCQKSLTITPNQRQPELASGDCNHTNQRLN
ncbi:hypothetical protein E2C01_086644 [Portunus trituberculatus]|uniref:Uncharacterized protein n=1 Tax=Portunus trituberculatus TaxID=210409 RepID=A0A5B7JF69_PORTR|nr:hypothetical protein [Portunus trituberculatus]